MSIVPALAVLAAEGESGPGYYPYAAAGIALIVLIGAMLALLAFGKGREHT